MILTIFGYPKSGKTLLFNLLTGKDEKISKFSTSSANEFHKALIDVPDERLAKLAEYFKTPPVYAKIEFLDTGALALGEGKNTTFIDMLRRADGLVHMVRGFEDDEIIHPKGDIDPIRDIHDIEDELITVDFLSVEKRIERLKIDIGKTNAKPLKEELEVFEHIKAHLEAGKSLREYPFNDKEYMMVKGYKFLSQQPIIHIINADENTYAKYLEHKTEPEHQSITAVFCAKIEQELLELDEEERDMFQQEYGLADYEYMRENFIKTSYQLLNLVSFFTVGSDETKAWTVKSTDNAWEASGKIHSDIQQGFIRAETIQWKDFLDSGGFAQAKDKGLLRLEGKEYPVKDGDIIHFRFNK